MTLGKRKERDEAEEPIDSSVSHGSTLFVANLPYTATSVDLQTLFSDIAPIRSAFVVTERETGHSKGVGYVSFSTKEDAEAALATSLEEKGIPLAGRKLRLTWAAQKSKHQPKEGELKKELKPKTVHPPVQRIHDPAAIRTIVLSGLPQNIDSKQLWKKVRKYEGAETLDWPHKAEDGTEDPSVAHVSFSTPSAANNAVTKLHAHVFKGSLLSATLKKRFDNLARPITTSTAEHGTAAIIAPHRGSRLIVRNLPFNITEQDLRALFLPYGPIYQIHIPTAQVDSETSGGSKPRSKGFAFIWMLSKKDAETAIQGCNGKLVRAGTAEEIISDKQKKKKQKRLEKKLDEAGRNKKESTVEGEGEDEEVQKVTERVIAVSWALSKQKWEDENAKMDKEEEVDVDVDMHDSDHDEESEKEEEENSVGSEEDENSVHEEDHEGEEPVKPSLPTTDVGTTIFIRNIPFTATEDEIRTLFRTFGPLRYARVTMDPETGRSRGTGFACFWNKEDADKAIEQSELLRTETTGNAPAPVKKNPFVLPSILTPDPSSSLAQSLVLHGRTLDVVRAVTRDQASHLKEQGEKARQKADKRNMYLLKEGAILPNSPLAQRLAPADLERRMSSHNTRRALLKSNPSLYISRTRLSVRQIPTFVSERVLKRLTIHAIQAFEAEVKEGTRTGLSPDESNDPQPTTEEGEEERHPKKQKRSTGRAAVVKQAKIVRQHDRMDPITGKGKSKGYGFIETHKHSDALRVLRWANCNSEVGSLLKQWYKEEMKDLLKVEKLKGENERDSTKIKKLQDEIENGPSKSGKVSLIVEFSIENVQVVQRRSARQNEPSGLQPPPPVNKEEPAPPKKKRKTSTEGVGNKVEERDKQDKVAQSTGSIIARKRRERRKSKSVV